MSGTIPIQSHARQTAAAAAQLSPWGPEVQRILCVRLDNLGDVLMTTPALHALRASAPERHITLLASSVGAEAARFIPEVDEVIRYEAPWVKNTAPHKPSNELMLRRQLEAGRYDAAVIFTVYSQNPLPAAMLCYLAGIPRRLAYCRENPYALLSDWLPETEPHEQVRHEVQRQLDLVGAVGASAPGQGMRLVVAPEDRMTVAAKLIAIGADPDRPYAVFHPGATASSRRWPPERFAQTAAALTRALDCQVIVTGGAGEKALAHDVCRAAAAAAGPGGAPHIGSLAGALTLGELAALIERAGVLVSNNSGPVHIASALGAPVVVLYALTNPQHMPWKTAHRTLFKDVPCRWCYRSVCPQGHHECLLGVSAEQATDAALAVFRSRGGAPDPNP
jgi:lipopolysaccharide heptosyltransferase II